MQGRAQFVVPEKQTENWNISEISVTRSFTLCVMRKHKSYYYRYYFLRHFSDAGIYDRIVVQELIKNMAQVQQLERDAQREFKGGFAYRSYLQLTACCS